MPRRARSRRLLAHGVGQDRVPSGFHGRLWYAGVRDMAGPSLLLWGGSRVPCSVLCVWPSPLREGARVSESCTNATRPSHYGLGPAPTRHATQARLEVL